jgi:hypothetical protein
MRMMKNNKISILRAIILAVGLIFVGLGVYFDGLKAVIANAIALCMSCIGLG